MNNQFSDGVPVSIIGDAQTEPFCPDKTRRIAGVDLIKVVAQMKRKPTPQREGNSLYFMLGVCCFALLAFVAAAGAIIGLRLEVKRMEQRQQHLMFAAPICDRRTEVCQ